MLECLQYIRSRVPAAGILENVEGFGHAIGGAGSQSPKEHVLQELRGMGYAAAAVHLSLELWLPCTRRRTVLAVS